MKKLNLFEIILILSISLLNILVIIFTEGVSLLGIISSIAGVICVIMTAKGDISCYYYGIINIITYAIIAYSAHLYGEVMLNAIYYIPMQFIGIYAWKKNKNKEELVTVKKITKKQTIIYSTITILGIILYGCILKTIGGNQPFVDALTTVLSVVAMYLSVKRFKEQWILWIIVNIASIYMWAVALLNNQTNSLVMVLMWTGYLINSFYGYINWNKMEKGN